MAYRMPPAVLAGCLTDVRAQQWGGHRGHSNCICVLRRRGSEGASRRGAFGLRGRLRRERGARGPPRLSHPPVGPTKPHPNPKLAPSNQEAAARETTSRQSGTSTPGHWRSAPRTSGRASLPGDRAAGARPPALSQRRPERARLSGVRAARGSPPPHYSESRRDAQDSPETARQGLVPPHYPLDERKALDSPESARGGGLCISLRVMGCMWST